MKFFKLLDRGDSWFELSFDTPDSKANVFTAEALQDLSSMIDSLKERRDIKGLVITSPKKDIFIAGADIKLIQALSTLDKAIEGASQGQHILQRLSQLPFDTVAAINGACLGGGFELALACKKRISSDFKGVKIGLPEVNLGILPGFGGSTRLPKLVKLQTALDLILSGKQLDGARALKAGVVDAVLPKEDFNERAIAWAKSQAGKTPRRPARSLFDQILESSLFRGVVFNGARKMVMKKTKGQYPAPIKIVELLQQIQGKSIEEGLKLEAKFFGQLAVTSVSKRLIELFLLAESVKKTNGVGEHVKALPVERAAVLGAGVMGGGIAWAFANKDIAVRMKDLNHEAINLGYQQAAENFGFALKTRKLNKTQFMGKMSHISGGIDYSGFKSLDVVVEAVVENMDVKKKVLQETEKYISPNCVFASNTSSLSITEMQSAAARPEKVGGLHFFNPVSRMPLVEVIAGAKTSPETVATLFELSKKLGKTPIVVKDGPGFLVNRLLLPYMNEALFLLQEGASIEHIDRVMLEFGMPMGPLRLVDEVGIDVAAKVSKILNSAFGIRAQASPVAEEILKSGRLGRKNGRGFYKYASGKDIGVDSDIMSTFKVDTKRAEGYSDAELVQRMVYPMINEAALALEEKIVETPGEVDLGMIMGTGFPPFRGGLLRHADSEDPKRVVDTLEKFSQGGAGDRLKPNRALQEVARRGSFYPR